MNFKGLDILKNYQEGGNVKVEEQISGRYARGVARPEEHDVNAEVEKNEFIQYPDGSITQVDPKGNSHAQGGELMNLPPETKILSDNIEIGKDMQEQLANIFGVKLKHTDTIAKAMEKVRAAIGMEAVLKEIESYLVKIKKNNEVKDEDTKRINEEFLANKLYVLEQQKKDKAETERQVFDLLFDTQEMRKQAEEAGDPAHQGIRKRPPVEQPTQEEMDEYERQKEMAKPKNTAMLGQQGSGAEAQAIPVMVENGGRLVTLQMSGGEIFADNYNDMQAVEIQATNDGYDTLEEFLFGGEVDSYKDGGGIPERYKKKGFTKVGVKKRASSGAKHKWEVLARKKVGGKTRYKIVKGGYRGMQDFKSHKDPKRKKRFWDRMGGKNSPKAKDPFSPLYWHKRFGTWEEGGETPAVVKHQNMFFNPDDTTEGFSNAYSAPSPGQGGFSSMVPKEVDLSIEENREEKSNYLDASEAVQNLLQDLQYESQYTSGKSIEAKYSGALANLGLSIKSVDKPAAGMVYIEIEDVNTGEKIILPQNKRVVRGGYSTTATFMPGTPERNELIQAGMNEGMSEEAAIEAADEILEQNLISRSTNDNRGTGNFGIGKRL